MNEKLDTNTFEFKVILHSGKLCLLFQLTTLGMKKFILGELDVKKTKIKKNIWFQGDLNSDLQDQRQLWYPHNHRDPKILGPKIF